MVVRLSNLTEIHYMIGGNVFVHREYGDNLVPYIWWARMKEIYPRGHLLKVV